MLRFKKPQPHRLGAYLRKKSLKRQWRRQVKDKLGECQILGEWEDEWDCVVREVAEEEGVDVDVGMDMARKGTGEGMESWTWGFWFSRFYLGNLLRQEGKRVVELSREMEKVVEKEKELKYKEDRVIGRR